MLKRVVHVTAGGRRLVATSSVDKLISSVIVSLEMRLSDDTILSHAREPSEDVLCSLGGLPPLRCLVSAILNFVYRNESVAEEEDLSRL